MQLIDRLGEIARNHYGNDDPGHDWVHIQRVMKTCEQIGLEEGADLEILKAAAMLLDLVNIPKDSPDRLNASQMAADQSLGLLQTAGYSEEQTAAIQTAIVEHSYSLGKNPSSLEAAILQDADRLDALGAVGVMRAVSCGTKMQSAFYNAKDPLAKRRELNDKDFTIDHFFVKLFRLPALMNTDSARREAHRRVEFMQDFLTQLEKEITH